MSGTTTAAQGGYSSRNHFAALTIESAGDDNASDDTAETIAGTINSYMANLSAQTTASIEANATQINASLQQLAANNTQLHQQQQAMMQQMAMLMTNATVARPTAYVPPMTYTAPPTQIFAAPPLQGLYTPRGGGCGGARSRGGRGRPSGRGNGAPGQIMLPPLPYVGGTGIIPYIPVGIQPPAQPTANPHHKVICQSKCVLQLRFPCGRLAHECHLQW